MISNSEKLCRLLGISPKNNKYPDLTEPYNFVKIMTLALEGQSLGTLFINYKKGDFMQDIFLDLIIQDVEDESYKQDWAKDYIEVRNNFIEKAKNTDWR